MVLLADVKEMTGLDIGRKAVLKAGGSEVGAITMREIPGVGVITFQYITDPEGNNIEIQHWAYFQGKE